MFKICVRPSCVVVHCILLKFQKKKSMTHEPAHHTFTAYNQSVTLFVPSGATGYAAVGCIHLVPIKHRADKTIMC